MPPLLNKLKFKFLLHTGMPMLTHEEIERLIADHKKKCQEFKHQLKEKCAKYGVNTNVLLAL